MPIAVEVNRVSPKSTPKPDQLAEDVRRVRALAHLMDAQFNIAGFKLGWDAIIGLVPVLGDTATALVGLYPILIARRHRLGGWLQLRMALNVLLDWAIGEVPLLGDFFDAAFKSNIYNAELLENAARSQSRIG